MLAILIVATLSLIWLAVNVHTLVAHSTTLMKRAELSYSDYPAFSRAEINHALSVVDDYTISHSRCAAEARGDWENVRKRQSELDEAIYLEQARAHLQFMIEGNLAVLRGEFTIAEARHLARQLEPCHLTGLFRFYGVRGMGERGEPLRPSEIGAKIDAVKEESRRNVESRGAELARRVEEWKSKFLAFNG